MLQGLHCSSAGSAACCVSLGVTPNWSGLLPCRKGQAPAGEHSLKQVFAHAYGGSIWRPLVLCSSLRHAVLRCCCCLLILLGSRAAGGILKNPFQLVVPAAAFSTPSIKALENMSLFDVHCGGYRDIQFW